MSDDVVLVQPPFNPNDPNFKPLPGSALDWVECPQHGRTAGVRDCPACDRLDMRKPSEYEEVALRFMLALAQTMPVVSDFDMCDEAKRAFKYADAFLAEKKRRFP